MSKHWRATAAEFFGTALFVFLGVGSVVMSPAAGPVAPLMVALAHGVALAIIVTATMNISGGHINPAVTAGLWMARKVDGRTAGGYVAAQLTGAVLGAALAKALLPVAAAKAVSLGTPGLTNLTLFQGIWIEAALTFFLVSAVFGTAVSPEAPKVGGFGIGLAVFVGALVGGPLTGAAMNPARAFGPAIVSWQLTSQAVYWFGPLLGSMAATMLWKYVLLPKDPSEI